MITTANIVQYKIILHQHNQSSLLSAAYCRLQNYIFMSAIIMITIDHADYTCYTAMQSQKAVSAYLTSNMQILPL